MKSTKTMAFVAAGLIILSGVCLLPSVAGQGHERSLEQKVTILEAQVAELTERVDELEGGSCACTTLNLQPLADFPGDPSEGDLCVIWSELLPGEYGNNLHCYLNGQWYAFLNYLPDPRQ